MREYYEKKIKAAEELIKNSEAGEKALCEIELNNYKSLLKQYLSRYG